MSSPLPSPFPGASLLLAFNLRTTALLIVGSNQLSATRAFAALEAGAQVILLAPGGLPAACPDIQARVSLNQIIFEDLDSLLQSYPSTSLVFDYLLAKYPHISLTCITDTISTLGDDRRSFESASVVADACRRNRVPINVADQPDLCTYTFPTSHRFVDSKTGTPTPLQVSVTTNGEGCRLGGRIKREIIAKLPKDIGVAVVKVGKLRELARRSVQPESQSSSSDLYESFSEAPTPNSPVPQTLAEQTDTLRRRLRWIAQLSEFWPVNKLESLTDTEMAEILVNQQGFKEADLYAASDNGILNRAPLSRHELSLGPRKGKIYLIGSGPGHPSLLTVAARDVLTNAATVVLSDKLVPAPVLELIPKSVRVVIARKFPGNADDAQSELMNMALEAALKGDIVVRLKQGDPMVYGRAGEEILFLRSHGFEPIVIPGLSSAITGPSFAGIPVTQRGVAESFVVCTGVGRGGKDVSIPGYERGRTTVILMGVARLPQLIAALTSEESARRDGDPYPKHLPIAIIERASMADQRVIFARLDTVVTALDCVEQRPPGMIIIGWAVLALHGEGAGDLLAPDRLVSDEARINAWIGVSGWRIEDGLGEEWLH